MIYGKAIGKKFEEDGSVRRYPGNTVVADILPGNPAYEVMMHLRRMVEEQGLTDHWILLPEDSYHMTVIRGVNDQVRTPDFWPEKLPMDAPMEAVDDYVSSAIERAGLPGPCRMRFAFVNVGSGAITVRVLPFDEEENRRIRAFRDRAAEEIGLYLPGHEDYKFHISLAYTRIQAEGENEKRIRALKEEMDAYLAEQKDFYTGEPYMAFYDDMLFFHPHRIPREGR